MSISAAQVKELRERTGAGMMECKKALVETDGDTEAAVELLRKTGLAKADKKGGRIAAEGVIAVALSDDECTGALVEINCETDFVTRRPEFRDFAQAVAQLALDSRPADNEALLAVQMTDGQTVDEACRGLVARIGEKITVRRHGVVASGEPLGVYVHDSRIGVLVSLENGNPGLAKDLAMHISWSDPQYIRPDDVPAEVVDKEREILSEQALAEGKPADIVEKMVAGRLRKYLAEITLVGQPFVKDPEVTVGKLLESAGAQIETFLRFKVGEGIEKKQEDFAAEVMAQARGA